SGIIRHGAKLLFAVAEATVPKVTVVLRKAYGAGYYAMNGRSFEADLIVAWPTAEIAAMGPEGAVAVAYRKELATAGGKEARRAVRERLVEELRSGTGAYVAAGWAAIDDVIEPAETRETIVRGLELAEKKQVQRPWRKHGVPPV